MKAIVQDRYGPTGDVLKLRDIDRPEVADDEVLVRVRAASVHPDVWHVVTGWPYALRVMGAGLRTPKNPVPGIDLSGEVEAVGASVTRFRSGDEVFGESHRGVQWQNGGAFAEYAAVPEDVLTLKPGNVTFEQAAAVPTSGIIALHNLRAARPIRPGQWVLVNGAGGGVGSIAVQLAKADGAHVTGVDSESKLELIRSLGADRVIDYAREDFIRSGETYDLIFDVASNLSFSECKRALAPTGKYIRIGHDHYGAAGGRVFGGPPGFLLHVARFPFDTRLPDLDFTLPDKNEAMAVLAALLERGKITPVIDRTFPLSQVPEALRYMQEGRAIGKVIIVP